VGGWMSGCRNSPAAGALLECEAEPWSANGGHVFFPLGPFALRTRTHTQSCTPTALPDCAAGGHHLNINVLQRETLIDAMEHPEKYPQVGRLWGGRVFV
jgi:hypothetical protein